MLIKMTLTPREVMDGLPLNLIPDYQEGHGFSDQPIELMVTGDEAVKFEISFDGESELLAVIKEKPEWLKEEGCKELLREQFSSMGDDEEEEDKELVPA